MRQKNPFVVVLVVVGVAVVSPITLLLIVSVAAKKVALRSLPATSKEANRRTNRQSNNKLNPQAQLLALTAKKFARKRTLREMPLWTTSCQCNKWLRRQL